MKLFQFQSEQEDKVANEIIPVEVLEEHEREPMEYEDTPYSNRIRTLLVIISFSPWGNLTRLAMLKLLTYTNAYVFYQHGTIIWINFTSCFIMGLANSSIKFWDCFNVNSKKHLNFKEMPLHAGITAGFCGCLSTLSSLLVELFYKTTNNTELKVPNHGYGVMEFFAVILGQMGLCFFGLSLGKDFGYLLDAKLIPYLKSYLNIKVRIGIELFVVVISSIFYIVNVILTAVLPFDNWYKQQYSLPIILGLPGTLIRFQLSYFNDKFNWFPLGTFLPNVAASIIMSILQILMYGYKSKSQQGVLLIQNIKTQWVLTSLSNGFCGSLSTIASLCYEIQNMAVIKHQYYYFMITLICCWSLVLIIVGSYQWTIGITPI